MPDSTGTWAPLCSWCGEPDTAAYHGCARPPKSRRDAGWPAQAPSGPGPARTVVLTPLGWQQAGYVWTVDGWKKKEQR